MKIGISSWTYSWAVGVADYEPERPMGALDLLERAHALGADVLQIADNLPLDRLEPRELDQLALQAERHGIQIEVGTRGLDPDRLRVYLELARKLNAPLVRTLAHDGDDRPSLDESARRIACVMDEFETAGIVLGVENHDFYPAQWFSQLAQRIASPCFGICLDAVNNLGQGESFREVLDCLAPHTVNFHCKDYTIRRKPTMLGFDVSGAALGEGMLDLHGAYSRLKPGISWVIELWTPFQENLEQTLRLEEEWVRRSMACLHALRAKCT